MSASDNSPQEAEQQKPQEAATPSYPTQGERIASGAKRDLLPTNYVSEQARILVVHAHPDDETSSTGATMAYYAQKGAEVYLITATRGELGEVIPPQLQHLEVGKPGCTDNGEALGEYRVGELNGALEALGVHRHLFLGQEPATAEGVPALYRDSGMAWGPNGKPIANPVSSDASLTAQPLEPQAQALVAAIHEIQPDVLVTYDADGGYGHPDHVRVHQIVKRALEILGDDEDRPLLTWGIEGEYNPEDTRVQAAIFGDGTAKRKAMEAHRTQITVLDDKTFEYSNKVPQKISGGGARLHGADRRDSGHRGGRRRFHLPRLGCVRRRCCPARGLAYRVPDDFLRLPVERACPAPRHDGGHRGCCGLRDRVLAGLRPP